MADFVSWAPRKAPRPFKRNTSRIRKKLVEFFVWLNTHSQWLDANNGTSPLQSPERFCSSSRDVRNKFRVTLELPRQTRLNKCEMQCLLFSFPLFLYPNIGESTPPTGVSRPCCSANELRVPHSTPSETKSLRTTTRRTLQINRRA